MAAEDQVALTGRNTTLHHKENHLVTSVWRPRNPSENILCFQRDRVFGPYGIEVMFQGLKLGIFEGGIAYTFYPGSRLIYQEAVVSTQEPNTAYLYDTGLRFAAPAAGVRPGRREVLSPVTYYDTDGGLRTEMTTGPDRRPAYVRYRAIAAQLDAGSLAVFPPPHT